MKRILFPLALALAFGSVSCGSDDDDMDTGNDSANDDGSAGPNDDGAPATSSSQQTCDSNHQCINDVCECTTPGKEGMACTDDVACEDECEVCS